jgi:outer membrane protein assembly factor BamE (lipoprotein component of BamABCDE complex)
MPRQGGNHMKPVALDRPVKITIAGLAVIFALLGALAFVSNATKPHAAPKPPAAQVAWSRVRVGMTERQVLALVGRPVGEARVPQTASVVWTYTSSERNDVGRPYSVLLTRGVVESTSSL